MRSILFFSLFLSVLALCSASLLIPDTKVASTVQHLQIRSAQDAPLFRETPLSRLKRVVDEIFEAADRSDRSRSLTSKRMEAGRQGGGGEGVGRRDGVKDDRGSGGIKGGGSGVLLQESTLNAAASARIFTWLPAVLLPLVGMIFMTL